MRTPFAAIVAVLIGLSSVGSAVAVDGPTNLKAPSRSGVLTPAAPPSTTSKPTNPQTTISSPTPAFDFALTNGGPVTLTQGGMAGILITATSSGGPAQSVSLSVPATVNGITVSLSQSSCVPTQACYSTLNISTPTSLSPGNYSILVTGKSGALSHTTTVQMSVNAAVSPPPSAPATVPHQAPVSAPAPVIVPAPSPPPSPVPAPVPAPVTVPQQSTPSPTIPSAPTPSVTPSAPTISMPAPATVIPSPAPAPTPSATNTASSTSSLAKGDRVQVAKGSIALNVRDGANGNIIGQQQELAVGTVTGSPQSAAGSNWVYVDYDSGVDGWSTDGSLVKVSAGTPPPSMPSSTPTSPSPAASASIPTAGLVGYWSFDDGTAADNSGNGYNGSLVNNPASVPGKVGKAFNFDGASNYIDTNSSSTVNNQQNVTMSAWVYATSNGYYPAIIGKTPVFAEGWAKYMLYLSGASLYPDFIMGGTQCYSSTAIPTNTWTLLTATNDNSNAKIYINGSLDKTCPSNPAPSASNDTWKIGSWGSNGFWPGKLDNVRLYNRALSAQEVGALYTAENGGVPSATTAASPTTPAIPTPSLMPAPTQAAPAPPPPASSTPSIQVPNRPPAPSIAGGGTTYCVSSGVDETILGYASPSVVSTLPAAPAGNDSNTGLGDGSNPSTTCWKTLQRAFDTSKPTYVHGADTLYVRRGEYDTTPSSFGNTIPNGSDWNHATIIAKYPGDANPVLRRYLETSPCCDLRGAPTDWAGITEDMVRTGIHLPTYAECAAQAGPASVAHYPDTCWSGGGYDPGYMPPQKDNGYVAGYVVSMSNHNRYIIFDGVDIDGRGLGPTMSLSCNHVCDVPDDSGDDPRHIRFTNLEIRNSAFSCMAQAGLNDASIQSDLEFINVKIHHCGMPYDTHTLTYQGQTILARHHYGAKFWHPWYAHTGGNMLINSETYEAAGTGLGPDGSNNIIRGNYVHDNSSHGIQIAGGNNDIIENNVFYNNATCMNHLNYGGHVVRNNTCIAGFNGRVWQGIILNTYSQNSVFENNIVVGYSIGIWNLSTQGLSNGQNIIRNNLVVSVPAGQEIPVGGGTTPAIVSGNIVNQDPQFVNPAAGDYRLQSGSPARDKGYANNLTTDFAGNARPQGAGIDIGAYEQ